MRVPWTARRSNQSILKEINPKYSLEALMLKLELKSFGHLVQRADSLKKILMLGKTEGKRKKGKLRMRWFQLNGHEFEQTPEVFKDGEAWCAMVHEVAKSQTCLSD